MDGETGTISVKKPEPIPNIILTYADGHQYKDYTSVLMSYNLIEDSSTLVSAVLNEGVQIISSSTFYNCSNLTSVTIADSVTAILQSAFEGCISLSSITIGNSVQIIDSYAFRYCSGLTSVIIPDSVTRIGNDAFSDCNNLSNISFGKGILKIESSAFRRTNLTSSIIPDNVENIESYAFGDCKNLESITIGNGVKNIGYRNDLDVFLNCSSIKYINYQSIVPLLSNRFMYHSNKIETVIIGDLTSSIGQTFSGQTHLTSIKIGSGVTKFDYSALQGCTSLTSVGLKDSGSSVELPNTISDIPNNLFSGCTSITSVTLPDSVITAQTNSFSYMDNVETIDLGNSLQILAGYNFYNDVKLKSVHLPKTITYIGQSVFFNCPSLTDINYDGTVEEWNQININSNWFYNLPQTSVIHCTDGDIPLYV